MCVTSTEERYRSSGPSLFSFTAILPWDVLINTGTEHGSGVESLNVLRIGRALGSCRCFPSSTL